jgi:hypothetical protein
MHHGRPPTSGDLTPSGSRARRRDADGRGTHQFRSRVGQNGRAEQVRVLTALSCRAAAAPTREGAGRSPPRTAPQPVRSPAPAVGGGGRGRRRDRVLVRSPARRRGENTGPAVRPGPCRVQRTDTKGQPAPSMGGGYIHARAVEPPALGPAAPEPRRPCQAVTTSVWWPAPVATVTSAPRLVSRTL